MSARRKHFLALTLAAAYALLSSLALCSCSHDASRRAIALPSTSAVRAPIAAAQVSNAKTIRYNRRAQEIAAAAVATGIAAGSDAALELRTVTLNAGQAAAETLDHLSAALLRVDELSAQLLQKQREVDLQTSALARARKEIAAKDEQLARKSAAIAARNKVIAGGALTFLLAIYFGGESLQVGLHAVVALILGAIRAAYRIVRVALVTQWPPLALVLR